MHYFCSKSYRVSIKLSGAVAHSPTHWEVQLYDIYYNSVAVEKLQRLEALSGKVVDDSFYQGSCDCVDLRGD